MPVVVAGDVHPVEAGLVEPPFHVLHARLGREAHYVAHEREEVHFHLLRLGERVLEAVGGGDQTPCAEMERGAIGFGHAVRILFERLAPLVVNGEVRIAHHHESALPSE